MQKKIWKGHFFLKYIILLHRNNCWYISILYFHIFNFVFILQYTATPNRVTAVMEAGLSYNFYRIFPVTCKNNKSCMITLFSSQLFLRAPFCTECPCLMRFWVKIFHYCNFFYIWLYNKNLSNEIFWPKNALATYF